MMIMVGGMMISLARRGQVRLLVVSVARTSDPIASPPGDFAPH